ncbi:alpha/beta fold hydrolase [Microbacterium sp. No. 7]|uniref:alpha/beta fold hydrolase n=1 Tax=Microbacterium sp. No. 7 TaxID=1714373 RepID=UPI0006D05293|nr:alpha/beta hydrolase [Microbacterium sp. No. 7]ALJ18861.1 hypothetical protein AOA12_02615 [Microbacterium sp. No. 7]
MEIDLPGRVSVDGAEIRYGVSGSGSPDVLLVHGNGAHHLWWHRVAQLLEPRHRLITLDLSGHGDSDHRPEYTPTLWSREVAAVLNAVGSEGALYVGHSMGGRLAFTFGSQFPELTRGAVVFDSSVRPPGRYRRRPAGFAQKPLNVYPSYAEAKARFRLLPAQPELPAEITDPIADYSIRAVPGGWSWKHDPRSLLRFEDAKVDAEARSLRAPLVYAYGSESVIVDDELADYVRSAVPSLHRLERIEGGHHHLVLDHPERCARIIAETAAGLGDIAEAR